MLFNIVTPFPNYFKSFLGTSLIKKSINKKLLDFNLIDLKDFAVKNQKKIDDTPYGGGPGMVLRVDVVHKALETISKPGHKIALTPKGKVFSQEMAKKLSKKESITLICGRYEGFDERVFDFVDEKVSIGKFVTLGGEAPATVIIESVARLIPGVIGKKESLVEESYWEDNKKEYPIYTKPREYKGLKVPEVLLSGNHEKIEEWRNKKRRK